MAGFVDGYSAEALGEAIRQRRLRLRPRTTQEALGRAAGYGSGAGVAVSRIESGLITIGDDRLNRIAGALGVQVDALVVEARLATRVGQGSGSAPNVRPAPLRERLEEAERRIHERVNTVTRLGDRLNAQQRQAQDNFVLAFIETAREISGAPGVDFPHAEEIAQDTADRGQQAANRIRLARAGVSQLLRGSAVGAAAGGAVGGAAAFGTFSLAAAFGTASTGTAIAALTGIAASNATFAFLGGGSLAAGGLGIVGGTAVLGAIVAAPVVLLGVGGGALWYRKKKAEAEVKVSQAEEQLNSTQPRYDALVRMLKKSADVLRDIRLFAARALEKWRLTLPEQRPLVWEELTPDQQKSYDDFITITACYLSVASMNPESFMDNKTPLEDVVADSNAVLDEVGRAVKELV